MNSEPNNPNDPTTATTFPQLIRSAAAAYGDEAAITYRSADTPDTSLSFAELDRQSAELARGLIARGVGKGSRVGFICGNGPTFALWFSAIARAGGVAIPISTILKSNELVRVIRQSDVAGVFVQRELLGKDMVDRIADALPELKEMSNPELRIKQTPFLRWVISTGDDLPAAIQPVEQVRQAASSVSEELLLEVESEIATTDQIMEIYTSGSMALPKGVKHNHGPIIFRAHYLRAMTPAAKRGAELIVPLPMFWVGGLMMYFLPNLEAGANTVCGENLLHNSRFAMGSVLAKEDLEAMRSKDMATIWGLGMTETAGPYTYGDILRVPEYPLCAPMDHIADRYEVRVADENNNEVAEGEIGEMQVRGYALSPGLHKVENDQYYTPDGYFHTGDLCFRQGSRILFVGRNGDMIKSASANVSPAEVEMEMQQLEGVHSAYVLGIPDKERGQLVVAAVVAREGVTLNFDDIEAALKQRMSGFKVPKAFIEFTREDIPLLPSNKVHRRHLETIMAEKLGRA